MLRSPAYVLSWLFLLALPGLARDYTERQEFTYTLAPNGRFYLKSEVGEVRVRASDRKDVHIVVTKLARNEDEQSGPRQVSRLRVDVSARDDEVRVRAVWPEASAGSMLRGKSKLQVDFEIEVPRSARLQLENGIGEVRVEGAGNDVIVREGIGEVSVSLAEGFQPRRVYLHTKIGDVDTHLPGQVRGWLGKKFTALLEGTGSLDIRLGIGDIRVSGGKRTAHL